MSKNLGNIAVLFLQPQCNMACSFCITRDGFQVMTETEARSIIVALEAIGVRNLIFGGGEPLCWPHNLLATARFAKDRGMLVQVGTNGIALTDDLLAAAEIDRFILPMESADATIHDSLRWHFGGHYAVIKDRLEKAVDFGKQVTISTVITRFNADGLADLAEILSVYRRRIGNLHAWHLYGLISEGRGGSLHGSELDPGRDRYYRVCLKIKAEFPELPILMRPNMQRSATVGFFWMDDGVVKCMSPYSPITAK